MKKKIAMVLLVTVMTASVFTGCGNSAEGDGKVRAAMADAGKSQEDSEGKAEGTEAGEPAPEATAEPTPETAAEPTAEPTPEATAEPTEEPASTAEPEKGTESGTAADSSQGAANNSDNSQTPQQDSTNQSGTNQSGQQGQQGQGTGNNGTAASANDTAASSVPDWFDPVFYAETYPDIAAVMGTDANALYQHYLDYGKAEGRKPSANSNTPSTTASNYLSQAFVNYLNEQRSAQGLSQITWNSGYESYALTRSQQLASNFSHEGMTISEIILATPSNDPASWYESFAESYGHNLVITDPHLQSGAAAVYQVGDWYYMILAYDKSNPTQEEIQEQINNGEMEAAGYYTDENGEQQVSSYVTAGGDSWSSIEDAANDGALSPEDIEWLKSIGVY